jgi:integrase
MAAITKRGDKWQVRIRNHLLPKQVLFATLSTESAARSYAEQMEGLLARGVVPVELMQADSNGPKIKLKTLIGNYKLNSAPSPAPSDLPVLELLVIEIGETLLGQVSIRWTDDWIHSMKVKQNLAPGTLRKRVESLSRAISWYIRRALKGYEKPPVNPLKLLPRGYSQYTPAEQELVLASAREVKKDVERNRRLHPEEEYRVRQVLDGVKRDDRQRRWSTDAEIELLFELILNTGVRLKEAYSLSVSQYDGKNGLLHVDGSKGHRGKKKPRVVPLVPELNEKLAKWCEGRVGLMFSYWDGQPENTAKTSGKLSNRFASLFEYAQVQDFTEHDLRHEATCRWITMKTKSGHWMWTEAEILKIMGWTNSKMLLRYLSLRGEDFANRMLG